MTIINLTKQKLYLKLYDDMGIITYSVGYGAEIASKPETHEHVQQFIGLAEAGGTHDVANNKVDIMQL